MERHVYSFLIFLRVTMSVIRITQLNRVLRIHIFVTEFDVLLFGNIRGFDLLLKYWLL
jgi:hypothetical protein